MQIWDMTKLNLYPSGLQVIAYNYILIISFLYFRKNKEESNTLIAKHRNTVNGKLMCFSNDNCIDEF